MSTDPEAPLDDLSPFDRMVAEDYQRRVDDALAAGGPRPDAVTVEEPAGDAVTFLLAAHERAERLAQASAGGRWVVAERADCDCCDVVRNETGGLVTTADLDDAPLIAEHANPTAVLLRVAAERELLAEHAGTWASGEPEYDHHHEVVVGENGRTRYIEVDDDDPIQPYVCITCEVGGWPCRTVLGLAKAWGWEGAADG